VPRKSHSQFGNAAPPMPSLDNTASWQARCTTPPKLQVCHH
jgi:hypothetical protein